jgi:hypothetical protein
MDSESIEYWGPALSVGVLAAQGQFGWTPSPSNIGARGPTTRTPEDEVPSESEQARPKSSIQERLCPQVQEAVAGRRNDFFGFVFGEPE